MIREGKNFVLCHDEQAFKMKYIRDILDGHRESQNIFCIETEETVKGFPDVMEVDTCGGDCTSYFYEFKISDMSGKIKFQPTQPAFYRAHPYMKVRVIAYNKKTMKIHEFYADEMFNEHSMYRMNLKAEVSLCKAERY